MTRRRTDSDPSDTKVAILLPDDLKMRLQLRAVRERRTMSECMVDAIKLYLKTPLQALTSRMGVGKHPEPVSHLEESDQGQTRSSEGLFKGEAGKGKELGKRPDRAVAGRDEEV